jgi:hypothetical protein
MFASEPTAARMRLDRQPQPRALSASITSEMASAHGDDFCPGGVATSCPAIDRGLCLEPSRPVQPHVRYGNRFQCDKATRCPRYLYWTRDRREPLRQRASDLRVLRDTIPRHPRLNHVPDHASVDPIEARKATVRRFGRSDRSAQGRGRTLATESDGAASNPWRLPSGTATSGPAFCRSLKCAPRDGANWGRRYGTATASWHA